MKVSLTDVEERRRLLTTRAVRERRWKDELRPDTGYSPTMSQRLGALWDAVQLERAALAPSRREYLVPEEAARKVLG